MGKTDDYLVNEYFRGLGAALVAILTGALAASAHSVAASPAEVIPARYSYGSEPGERVPDISVEELGGARVSLHRLLGKKGAVFITRDIECPVSQRYLPRINQLAAEYAPKGIAIVILDVTPHSTEEARAAMRAHPGIRAIHDERRAAAAALGASTTAEVFLVDAAGTLQYRGAIDDQYGIGHQNAKVRHPWLRNALDRLLAGEQPSVRRSDAPGCAIAPSEEKAATLPVIYHGRVSRIIQDKCMVCHRVGGLGPMPLENYRQVYERRAVIAAMVGAGLMPPWSARKDVGAWANDRSLRDSEKADLLAWIKQGAPEGDPREAPLPRRFRTGWHIGKPDAIVPIPEPIRVPAEGVVAYKNVFVQTRFTEDKWVSAVEIRPTQPKVVHHVIVVMEEPGRKPLTPDELARYKPGNPIRPQPVDTALTFFAITVPGSMGITYPEGTGKKLPKGAWLRFEIHYQPNGATVTDRTEIGFRFSKAPLREVQSLSALNTGLVIPPYNPRYKVAASYKFREPGKLVSLFPHMHLRGTAFRYDLKYPDGRTTALLDVPKFDFNWQSYYEFQKPFDVPAGSELLATAWYDNSAGNSWNPDPSRTVRWGPQTTEEMMIGYFDFISAGR